MYAGHSAVTPPSRHAPEPGGTYGHSSRVGVRRLGAGLGLAVLLLLLGFVARTGPMTSMDTAIDRAVSHARVGVFTPLFTFVTLLATPELWAVVGVLGPVLLFAVRRRGQALRVFCVLIGSTGVAYVAKALVDEHRPPRKLWLEPAGSDGSFPSGHTTAACAIVVSLLILVPYAARRPVAVAGCVFIVLVALSRIYLGVHYPPDVAGGVLATATATVFLSGLAHLPPGRRWLLKLDNASRGGSGLPPTPRRPAVRM